MKPISNEELENAILDCMSSQDTMSSNELHRKLKVNKTRYTQIRNELIEQGVIKKNMEKNRMYLSIISIMDILHPNDIVKIPRTNCEHYLKSLKYLKPIGIIGKNKVRLKLASKKVLDALFWQLDSLYAIQTRLIYAQSFNMISSRNVSFGQKKCKELFSETLEKLFKEHKPFKKEIIQQYQSKLRQLKFNL